MTPEETVDEFIRRVCAVDLAGAGELVSDDIEYDNVPMGKNFGRAALTKVLGSMVRYDEIEFVTHRQTATDRTVMNERSDRFRLGTKWIDLPVAGVFELDEQGRISLWRDYFDLASYRAQIAAATADG
jgi:limonene-1,2-epoxide hydrolase